MRLLIVRTKSLTRWEVRAMGGYLAQSVLVPPLCIPSIGPRLFNALPRFIKESSTLDSFKAVLDDFLMTLPDTPPTPGYIAANNNSLLDWIVTNSRALPEVLS